MNMYILNYIHMDDESKTIMHDFEKSVFIVISTMSFPSRENCF